MVKRRLRRKEWQSISAVKKSIGKKSDAELIEWLEGAKRLRHSRIKENVIAMLKAALRERRGWILS